MKRLESNVVGERMILTCKIFGASKTVIFWTKLIKILRYFISKIKNSHGDKRMDIYIFLRKNKVITDAQRQ